jgi:lipoyl(octanoyl) transferase
VPTSRILVDRLPEHGAWNMAVDEVLLESAVAETAETLRLYRWAEPTLSLGYFQSAGRAAENPLWRGLPVVRRLSGGGAIVHDCELTYALALPASRARAQDPKALYHAAHHAVIDALRSLGFDAALRGRAVPARGAEFLCFARGDDFDVVAGDVKILGSAQRRRKGAVLQHGGLILRRSRYAPEIPGLFDCAGAEIAFDRLLEVVAAALGSLLSGRAEPGELTPFEHDCAGKLRDMRYSRSLD